jgi:hypothetical protein
VKILQIKSIVLDLPTITFGYDATTYFEFQDDDRGWGQQDCVDSSAEAKQRIFQQQAAGLRQISRGVPQKIDLFPPRHDLRLAIDRVGFDKSRGKCANHDSRLVRPKVAQCSRPPCSHDKPSPDSDPVHARFRSRMPVQM